MAHGTAAEEKVCFYIAPMKREVSKPFTMGMYPEEICKKKLKKISSDLCEVKGKLKTNADTDYGKVGGWRAKRSASEA